MVEVEEIQSGEEFFSGSIFYVARWKDPTLAHPGPGTMKVELSKVWNPGLVIVNLQRNWETFPEVGVVSPDGTVEFRQKVWGRFSQRLDLHDFPFDRQSLTVRMVSIERVKLVPFAEDDKKASNISKPFLVPDFAVRGWQAQPTTYVPDPGIEPVSGFEMRIDVERRGFYYFFKVVIPLCMIVVMSWLPRWSNTANLAPNVALASTAFLSLIAYLFNINAVLPPMPYLTRMDRFVFLSISLVFIGLVQTVATAALYARHRTRVRYVEQVSRAIYPLVFLMLMLAAFAL